jgi:dihydropyrimidinase
VGGTNHGAIQTVATDEICCPLKFKLQGDKIDDTTGGNAGVEPRVSLIYTETSRSAATASTSSSG